MNVVPLTDMDTCF